MHQPPARRNSAQAQRSIILADTSATSGSAKLAAAGPTSCTLAMHELHEVDLTSAVAEASVSSARVRHRRAQPSCQFCHPITNVPATKTVAARIGTSATTTKTENDEARRGLPTDGQRKNLPRNLSARSEGEKRALSTQMKKDGEMPASAQLKIILRPSNMGSERTRANMCGQRFRACGKLSTVAKCKRLPT